MQGMPHNDLPTQEGALPTGRREHLPWSTLSHRALGEAAAPCVTAATPSGSQGHGQSFQVTNDIAFYYQAQ